MDSDAQQSVQFSLSDLQSMLQTNKTLSSSKLKRLMKKFGAKSSSATVEDVANLILSLSEDDEDDVFRSVMSNYKQLLGGSGAVQLDSSAAASTAAAVTAASTANAPTSVHAQASVPSVALDHAVDPTASAATTAAAAEKFLCKPWLDAIFMAIYGDLVACAACSLPHHPHVQRVFLQILRLVGPRRPPQA